MKLECYHMGCKREVKKIVVFSEPNDKEIIDIQIVGYCLKHFNEIKRLDSLTILREVDI